MQVRFADHVVPPEIDTLFHDLARHAVRIDRDGAGPGSLTEDGLHYSMVNGEVIVQQASIVDEWVRRIVPAYASGWMGVPLRVSPDVASAINVNVLTGRGEQYEWHTDPCPYSGLLFLTGPHRGGAWLAEPDDGVLVTVEPRPGRLVVFAGHIPHAVQPLNEPGPRISVPVALYPAHTLTVERDPELNAHIGLAAL